ncbi:MAG: hypothetical protein NTW18_01075 [Candidatus Omnitrophica bacterium]|nr:hypothetical protein [Candidatus Omnitrophota bacterium]
MNILGLSCFYHDSAACLTRDGEITAAAQEERFSRKKYDPRFPTQAINWCLKYNNVSSRALDRIACCGNNLSLIFNPKVKFYSPRDAYLAAAYYPSPFKEALILVNDVDTGVIFGRSEGERISLVKNSIFKYPLGKVYARVSRYLGFGGYGDEFKVMGLAAYGKPIYKERLLPASASPRGRNDITQFHMDVAASLQVVMEEEVLKITEYLSGLKMSGNLCLSGNMALNCLINAKIIKQGLFKNIWIQPASANAGCALGAALLAWYEKNKRNDGPGMDKMSGSFLGPDYNEDYIENFLRNEGILYKKLYHTDIAKIAAGLIAQGKVVGWFQGRAEFGPRALGNRSILGDSRDLRMHKKLNLEVKRREAFRPFAPTVLWEKAGDYFELDREDPFMLFTAQVKEEKKAEIPAVVHIDGSSRVQTIKKENNPLYYDLVNEFYQITGCPVIINTSFNSGPEPMVLSPEDAYRCFKSSAIDCLVLGRYLVEK